MAQKEQRAKEVASPEKPRLFFAVEISGDVRDALADLNRRLQKAAQFTPAKITWVPPENFHITLFFLGEVELGTALKLKELLPNAVSEVEPFSLDMRHIGTFPKGGKVPPRVLWVGSFNTPEGMHRLRKGCASVIAQAGLPIPEQDFSPHITLARFRSGAGLGPFLKILREYEHYKAGKSPVTRLVLMESQTGGGPARYAPYATMQFAQQGEVENE
jgi:2'-5' RNA ligase